MRNLSKNSTIIFYTDNAKLLYILETISAQLNIDLYIANAETDIIAVPYFFAFVEGRKLKEDTLTFLAEMWCVEDSTKFGIMFTKEPKSGIPFILNKYTIELKEDISYDGLYKIVKDKYDL